MIKIDEHEFRQRLRSRGGRSPIKITMANKTREKLNQILYVGPGGSLSAFVDWANRLLLYIIGVGDIQELQGEARAIITMFRDIQGEAPCNPQNATALVEAAHRLETIVIALWGLAEELAGGPNYHIHQEIVDSMIEEMRGGPP